jgi:hypothetical protein
MFDEEKGIELIWTVAGSALLGLAGFVWKISHRTSSLESRLAAMENAHSKEVESLRRDLDTIAKGLDKNREWTTNRMMSIAKEMKD